MASKDRPLLRMMKTREKDVKRVLVGVDFSEASEHALIEALRLAQQQRAEVFVAHIIDSEMMQSLIEHSHLSKEQVIASIQTRLESFCENAGAKSGDIQLILKVGHAVKEFANLCDLHEPDLVVLGAWGSHSESHDSAGATAKQIVQEIRSDVLLMRPRENGKFSKVAACIDFSLYDKPVIRAADQICLADEGCLEILHVFYPSWKEGNLSEADREKFSPDFEQEYKAVLRGRLDQLVPRNVHGVSSFETLTTIIESKTHSGGILNHLKKAKADVAVIGARGASKIESMILGRIAERIVTESSSSVYVVKDHGED